MPDEIAPFKQCPRCGFQWRSFPAFVVDEALHVEGYQACPPEPDCGVILLTHCVDGCHTTLGIVAGQLRPLYVGPFWPERQMGLEPCRRLCIDPKSLEECTAECDLAWVRHALQWLRRHELSPRVEG